jgi:O-antigen ligase
MVLTGCAVTLAWGFWRHYITHERFYVELNSVGAVNHSTIYLAICAMFALSWLFASWSRWGASRRLATSMLLLFFLVGLFIESSRGAIGATFVAIVVVAAAWRRRSRVPLAILSISLIVGLLAAVTGNVEVVEKQRAGMQSGDYLSKRGSVWNRAVVAWQAHPWFGVGIDNFAMIDDDMLRRQVERNGGNYVRENYSGTNHAHNLYLNTLAERGVFGFSVLALAFASWAAMLLRSRPPPEAADIHWLYWSSSVSAWIIIAGAGMFNTTFHHEISLLALLILGGWMSLKRQPQA